jgi:predicted transport protein
MEQGLLEKTGKSLVHWVAVVKKSGIEKHKAIIDFLKAEYDFTYGFANFVAHKSRESDAASHDAVDLVSDQYQGKESLKPIYDLLVKKIMALGHDITQTPKKAAVSFIRKHQFVLIKPATKTRIDLGLKLKGKENSGRLEDSGPFGTMCTHRVQITGLSEVDDELMTWIKEAYEKSV